MNSDAKVIRNTEGHRTTLTANGDFAKTEEQTTAQQVSGSATDRHDLTRKTFANVGAGYQHNDLTGIDHNARASTGLGYYIRKDDKVEWAVDAGPAYVYEQRKREKGTNRANARLGHELKYSVREDLRLFQSGEILSVMSDPSDWRYNTEAGVETDLNDHMSLRFSGRNRFESQAPEDRKQNDFSIGASLVFKLD